MVNSRDESGYRKAEERYRKEESMRRLLESLESGKQHLLSSLGHAEGINIKTFERLSNISGKIEQLENEVRERLLKSSGG